MNAYIQDLRDITDSREMLESKPHSLVAYFAYILIALIAVVLIWSYFGEIEDYVKATGTVRPGDRVSTIRNAVAGRVDEVHIEEGKRVKKGDVLYTIELSGVLLEKKEWEERLEQLEIENSNLLKYRQSILEGRNLFDNSNTNELEYYNRYKKYETDRLVSIEQYNNQTLDMEQLRRDSELSLNIGKSNLNRVIERLEKQRLLEQSIINGQNLFNESDVEHYNRYIDYEVSLKRLKIVKTQKEEYYIRLKRLYDVGGIARIELEEAKSYMDIATLELNKFKSDYIINLKNSIEQIQQSKEEIESSIKKAEGIIEIRGGKSQNKELMLEKMKLDTLVQIEDALISNRVNIDKARNTLKSIELNIEEAVVTAPIDGIVNMHTEINTGDLLQGGLEIATIIPDTATEYKIQIMVSNEDIAQIKEGQRIKYNFFALPQRDYGEAYGVVNSISTDSRVDNQTGMSYYIVEASLENRYMESSKGVTKEIRLGMACEVQVITKSRKVLHWLLEKIDFLEA